MRRASFILAAALLVGACGSGGGLGDLGSIILGSPSTTQSSDVKGTVDYVDTGARRIDLNVSYINNLRDTNNGQRGAIYYTDRTRVVFENRDYAVGDLERGDEIEVRGVNDGGRYVAETITVVRDATR